jgi:hypothetical protein
MQAFHVIIHYAPYHHPLQVMSSSTKLGDTPRVTAEIFKQNYKVKIWKYKLIAMQNPMKARMK